MPSVLLALIIQYGTSAIAYAALETSVLSSNNRSLLQAQDVLQHLHYEHSQGNSHPTFTLSLNTQHTAIEVDIVQPQNAILPSARYSIHDRASREVGHLGYDHLVSTKEDQFVLLTVNRVNGEVRGVAKQFDEEWVVVNNAPDSPGERNLEGPVNMGDESSRDLQAFHSDYLHQIDLHLDIDYELVKNNEGSLCNVFNYINSLVTAANTVLERDIMTHINVKYIRQTDFYDDVDSTLDVLDKMKRELGGAEWNKEGIDLHYALLGKTLMGGLEERSGIAFIEDSLCDSTRGFGVVSGLEGGFDSLDERLGTDLKRFLFAIG